MEMVIQSLIFQVLCRNIIVNFDNFKQCTNSPQSFCHVSC